MTTDEFIKDQGKKLNEIIKFNKPLAIAVNSIMAKQVTRIFINGQNESGSEIGEYKKSGVYINPNNPANPKKFATGKFKNGKKRKTKYFESFLEYKKAIGRNKNIKTINFYLTGELLKDWSNSNSKGKKAFSNPKAKKINAHKYEVSLEDNNEKKISRYKSVFGVSKKEYEEFLYILKNEFENAMQ